MGLNTELGERKLTILKAIIQNYLETGEPVGSRTLSKYTDLNLILSTIRTRWLIWRIWDIFSAPHFSGQDSFGQRISVICRYADGREGT